MKFKILKVTEVNEDENKMEDIYYTVPANPISRWIAKMLQLLSLGESDIITLHLSRESAIKYIKNYKLGIKKQFV